MLNCRPCILHFNSFQLIMNARILAKLQWDTDHLSGKVREKSGDFVIHGGWTPLRCAHGQFPYVLVLKTLQKSAPHNGSVSNRELYVTRICTSEMEIDTPDVPNKVSAFVQQLSESLLFNLNIFYVLTEVYPNLDFDTKVVSHVSR